MVYYWVATEALTGNIITDLPNLICNSVKLTLGRYESCTVELPIPSATPDWPSAVIPGAVFYNLLFQDTDDSGYSVGDPFPIWGGMVTRTEFTESDVIKMSLATPEAYFDRRYVGNLTATSIGQNVILSALISGYASTGPAGAIPFIRRLVTAGSGTLRDRSYLNASDKTLYSALTDLMGVSGGPEWTVGWQYFHNPERILPVFYYGDLIGAPLPAGLDPAVTWEMPGSITKFSLLHDFSASKSGNAVMARSDPGGSVRKQSALQSLNDGIRPTFEYRWTPSTSIESTTTLNNYAIDALAALSSGTKTLTFSVLADKSPKLGVDWFIGDSVGFKIGGLNYDGVESVPSLPGGISGTARVVGWELSLGSNQEYTPILSNLQLNS